MSELVTFRRPVGITDAQWAECTREIDTSLEMERRLRKIAEWPPGDSTGNWREYARYTLENYGRQPPAENH